jgi:hypothetical protein
MLALPSTANASPWTLPEDSFAAQLAYSFSVADQEYLPTASATRQAFPLDGRFSSGQLDLAGRYGFTDKLEGEFGLAVKHLSYDAEPYLLPEGSYGSREEVYEESLVDFSDTRMGVSHIDAALRYNFLDVGGMVKLTSETALKLPTGYEAPQGTFAQNGSGPPTVQDDVALGDGQTDLTQSAQFGFFVPATATFGRVDAGFRLRFGSPGHQATGVVKLGQRLGDSVLVYGRLGGAYTVTEGEVIGQSVITDTPNRSSRALGPNRRTVDLRLDRDFLQLGGGVIVQLGDFEVQASYSYIPVGRNIPALHTATLGSVFTIPDAMGEADETEDAAESAADESSQSETADASE